MKPKIVIVGASSTGVQLIKRLVNEWEIALIDTNAEVLEGADLQQCTERIVGDATSALVLRQANAQFARAMVACTHSDEVNLEALRVGGRDFDIDERFAVMRDTSFQAAYVENGVELVNRTHACAALLASLITGGRRVATNIGLGQGEIMEVEVLPNSSGIGCRLADLHPRSWLVGAVYRDGKLIVPHGDTRVQAGDRVVIVGDPEILPLIATHIGAGESKFPLHYGSKVGIIGTSLNDEVLEELRFLINHTEATGLHILHREKDLPQSFVDRLEQRNIDYSAETIVDANEQQLASAASARDVGVLTLIPTPLPFWRRVGIGRSSTIRLINNTLSPVLIPRGTYPYLKVLICLAELPFDLEAARLAVDLVRMVGAELHLVTVQQPELVAGTQLREEIVEKCEAIEALARMYQVTIHKHQVTGNPITEIVKISADYNLLVLPYKRNRRSFLTNPDVSQNLIHRAKSSVMVMPH